jgi:hypothetical protein
MKTRSACLVSGDPPVGVPLTHITSPRAPADTTRHVHALTPRPGTSILVDPGRALIYLLACHLEALLRYPHGPLFVPANPSIMDAFTCISLIFQISLSDLAGDHVHFCMCL